MDVCTLPLGQSAAADMQLVAVKGRETDEEHMNPASELATPESIHHAVMPRRSNLSPSPTLPAAHEFCPRIRSGMQCVVSERSRLGMRVAFLLYATYLSAANSYSSDTAPVAPAPGMLIKNVHIVDVEHTNVLDDQWVLLEGERISGTGSVDEVPGAGNAVVVDGKKGYLIPGLFDAHVHLTSSIDTFTPLLVAHGVTAVRDLGGPTQLILSLKRNAADRDSPCPDIFATGAIVDGDPPIWPFSEACKSAEDARAAVRRLASLGVDQIKVYSMLTADAYRAAVEEATSLGLKVTGHVPSAVRLEDVLKAGQDCIEHLEGFGPLLAELAAGTGVTANEDYADRMRGWLAWNNVDRARLRSHLAEHAAAGVTHCPTLIVMHSMGRIADAADPPQRDPRMKYVSPRSLNFWNRPRYAQVSRLVAQTMPARAALTFEIYRAGIPLVVGTDLANPYVFAGSSVHDEMNMFQAAGIPAADVLKMATIGPAVLCDAADRLGSIATGKVASLVLLRENPLEDIAHVSGIEAVWLRGRHLDRSALDALLAKIERDVGAANPLPVP